MPLKPLPQKIATAVRARGGQLKPAGDQWLVTCPSHEDSTPSVAIKQSDTGNYLLYCHANCETPTIVAAWGLTLADLMDPDRKPEPKPREEWTPEGPASAVYTYTDEQGEVLYEVLRIPKGSGKKTFRQRRPDSSMKSGWAWNLQGTRRVIYRLPKVLEAISTGEAVYVCYTPDTEVLTLTGWVPLPDLPHGIPVAQWDITTEQISFAQPTAYQQFDYEGDLVHVQAKWCDLLVTPDHRQPRVHNGWRRNPDGTKRLVRNKPSTITADQIKPGAYLPVAGAYKPQFNSSNQPDEIIARLLVAWLADGCYKPGLNTIKFHLKKDRKKNRLRALLTKAGISWEERGYHEPGWTDFLIKTIDFTEVLTHSLDGKQWKWEWLHWGYEIRETLIDELGHWDGDYSRNSIHRDADLVPTDAGIRFSTGTKTTADVVAAMSIITSYSASVRTDTRPYKYIPKRKTTKKRETITSYLVNIQRKRTQHDTHEGRWRNIDKIPDRVPYKGDVWCLTVPTSYLVVRRNGKIIISGNCEGEKDVHSLEKLGHTATTNSGGASKWLPEFSELFSDGARVIIISDADKTGREHARKIFHQMKEGGVNVTLTEPADGCKDVTDHINAGLSVGDLMVIENVELPDYGLIDIHTLLNEEEEPYEWVVPGLLEKGDRIIITGIEGSGKALDLRTSIPTPTGWTTMGEIAVGDQIIDRDGNPCAVVATSELQQREAYIVTFNTGETIFACADHQWVTQTLQEREKEKIYARRAAKRDARVAAGLPAVASKGNDQTHKRIPTEGIHTTQQVMDTLRARTGKSNETTNHAIKAVLPIQLPEAELPIDPYTLGIWLGDGSSNAAQLSLNGDDAEHIIVKLTANGTTIGTTRQAKRSDGTSTNCLVVGIHGLAIPLRDNGLKNHKHIPDAYLRASFDQRLALLQGLMDTDGHAQIPTDTKKRGGKDGVYEIIVTTKYDPLADGVLELLYSLGIIPQHAEKIPTINGIEHAPVHRINFHTDLPVFTVPRKAERMRPPKTNQPKLRYITNVRNTKIIIPMKCIQVDSPSHTYLAGEGMIPTHNSFLLRQIAVFTSAGMHPLPHAGNRTIQSMDPQKVFWVDAENSRRQNRRTLGPMVQLTQQLQHHIPPGHFTLALRPEGLDLTKPYDQDWLEERMAILKPDLVIIGPWYRLFNNDPSDESAARHVIQTIDTLRAKYNFTTLIEAHSPHSTGGPNKRGGVRPVRPIGSSILLRWPEFGYGLSFRDNNDPNTPDTNGLPDFSYADLLAWRGARDERDWPQALCRGSLPGDPPWLAADVQPMDSTPNQRQQGQVGNDTRHAYSNGRGGMTHRNRYEKDNDWT